MKIERKPIAPLREKLDQELSQARSQALASKEPIEPTDEEKRNGWTTESLTEYLAERHAAHNLTVDVSSITRKSMDKRYEANHKYNAKHWRRR